MLLENHEIALLFHLFAKWKVICIKLVILFSTTASVIQWSNSTSQDWHRAIFSD